MSESVSKDARLAVLALDRECAEWSGPTEDGRRPYGVANVQGEGVPGLAQAATEAVASANGRPGRCVLALGAGLVRQRLLSLPELSRRETRAALQRKAAALCECELDDVAFTAIGFDEPANPAEPAVARAERRWLLVAVRRAEVRALQLALARRGFRVTRIVSSQLSTLARGQALRVQPKEACIVVAAQRKHVSVGLVCGETLVNENLLEGDIRSQPSLAMSLVQETKSFDAAWRKANRGGAVAQVVLLGLPADRSPLFKTAISSALPSAQVILRDAAAGDDGAEAPGRREALEACLETGGLQTDLTLPLPLRRRTALLLLSAIFATLATVATVAYRPTRRAELQELSAVAVANARTSELEAVRARNADAEHAIERLRAVTRRNHAVLAYGWDLRGLLAEVVQALGPQSTFVGLELSTPDKHELRVEGVASPDPVRATQCVDRAVQVLEDSTRFSRVTALPAGELPDGAHPIHFAIEARAEDGS